LLEVGGMTRKTTKLSLNKLSLRKLDTLQLRNAAGGRLRATTECSEWWSDCITDCNGGSCWIGHCVIAAPAE
jgi:hypothetical protein